MPPILEQRNGVSIIVQGREHLPPHVHASYGEDEALVNIRTGEIHEGYIAPKQLKVVQEWLMEGDNRDRTEKNFYELNPRLEPGFREAKKSVKKKNKVKKTNSKKKKGGK